MDFNKIIIVGHVGSDPELHPFPSGAVKASFSVATSRKGRDEPETTWHNVECWSKTAEFAGEYIHKGDKVLVEGEQFESKWENTKGEKRSRPYISAFRVVSLTSKTKQNDPDDEPF